MLKPSSSQWYNAGLLLGLKADALENIKQKSSDNAERFVSVLTHWIDSNGHPNYPLTWDGLCELLCDIDRDTAAEELKQALTKCSFH